MPTLRIAGRYEHLVELSQFVRRCARRAKFGRRAAYAVELAVEEAAANIIRHGYGGEDRGEIECRCAVVPHELTVTLRDWGAPFDPTQVPEPDFSTMELEDLPDSGAGVFLMRRMMDEVRYRREDEAVNCLVMVKRASDPDDPRVEN